MNDSGERALAPGVGLAIETVRVKVNDQFPQLMLSLYPRDMATCPLPFGSFVAKRLALGAHANNTTHLPQTHLP